MIYLAAYDSGTMKQTDKRQREYMLGRTLLKVGLQKEYALFLSDLTIGRGKHGKPYLEEYPEIYFNISHCNSMVVCGIHDRIIGVDVERIRPYSQTLPPKILSKEERAAFADKTAVHRAAGNERRYETYAQELFFRYWTLKESHIKATGAGLSMPMKEITFFWEEETGKVVGNQPGYTYYQTCLENTYIIAVCVKNPRG